MEQYAVKMQKRLRKGFTTGSCAAAAAQAAACELFSGVIRTEAVLTLPNGQQVTLATVRNGDKWCSSGSGAVEENTGSQPIRRASYYVVKDAGDDPDVTNGTRICATIELLHAEELKERRERTPYLFQSQNQKMLYLTGGVGIGVVTKPGLEQEIGYPAINRVPRRMIFEAAEQVLRSLGSDSFPKKDTAALITISAPEGKQLAQKTFNPQIGIQNGISILGTSGIVEPMSEAALVATIELETKQVLCEGQRTLLYVPGNYGDTYVRRNLGLSCRTIQCSNYIGDAIDLAVAYGAEAVLLVGNFGKLVKIAGGIMNTHSKTADCRWEIVGVHAALCGAAPETIQRIRKAVTTDAMLKILDEAEEAEDLKRRVSGAVIGEIGRHLTKRAGEMKIGAIVYSEAYGYLGETDEASAILEYLKRKA